MSAGTRDAVLAVVIPAHNAGSTIVRAIESVLSQQPRVPEIVVVDDGSTDDTVQRVAAFSSESERVHLLRHCHAGVSSARNLGVAYALSELSAEIVGFMDSDDTVSSRHFANLVAGLGDERVVAVLGDSRYVVRGHARRRAGIQEDPLVKPVSGDVYSRELVRLARPTSVWAYVFRSSVLQDSRFDPAIHVFEDLDFLLRVLPNARSIGVCAGSTYRYEVQPTSVNRQAMGSRWMTSIRVYRRARQNGAISRADADVFGAHLVATLTTLGARLSPKQRDAYTAEIGSLARSVLRTAVCRPGVPAAQRLCAVGVSISPHASFAIVSTSRRLRRVVRSVGAR